MENEEREKINLKTGLSSEEVQKRIEENLVNYVDVPPTKTIKQIIISNFCTYFNFLNVLLGGAILVAGIIGGKFFDAIKNCLFMGVIIANSVISTAQEIISKKIIDKLSVLSASKVASIRDGKEVELSVEEIVLDDILEYKLGNQVVVDSIIREGTVEVNEAFITGESKAIIKKKGDTLLSGSFIVSGFATVQVLHIGADNYISKISKEAKYDKKANSVIMSSFEGLLKVLSIAIIPVGILLLINQMEVTNDITNAIFNTVGALIGMIPEGLLLLTSSVMAVSVARLAKFNVLVQQLYCIETLARVDVICLDKTGTITSGEMRMKEFIADKGVKKDYAERVISNLCYAFKNVNDTMKAIQNKYTLKGTWEVIDVVEFS